MIGGLTSRVRSRVLAAEATVLLNVIWIGLHTIRFLKLRWLLQYYGRLIPRVNRAACDDEIFAVTRAVRQMRWRPAGAKTCLVEGLTVDALLRRRGFECTFRIGTRLTRDASQHLLAHAWVEHHGTVVFGEIDALSDYVTFRAGSL